MMTAQWKSSMPAVAVTVLLLAAAVFAAVPAVASENPWGASYFPNMVLTTHEGKTVHLWDDLLKDKKVVINFIYTHCGDSCPLETAKLAQVQKLLGDRMGKDIFFYSVTLDPKHDTPEVLNEYAKRYHVGPGWLFLTGSKADIEILRKKLGQATTNGQNDLSDHKTSLMIGNVATGQWMQDSSMDDPNFIAVMTRDWLSSWKGHKPGRPYDINAKLPGMSSNGGYLFKTRCSACHTIGDGDLVGPDLKNVIMVRDREWLSRFVSAPESMLATDPIAKALFKKYNSVQMPNLKLPAKDVEQVLKYIEAASAAGAKTVADAAGAVPAAGQGGEVRR